jgi:glycoside/pentoside/hexuronide:cation symporter, GPH family
MKMLLESSSAKFSKQMSQKQKAPLFVKLMYALGQYGWSLANSCVMLLVIYFYIPPDIGDGEMFPEFIERKKIFLSFTAVGLMMFFGIIISALFDIIMGPVSDRTKSKFGRRRLYMAISFVPIVICTLMAFFPIVQEKSLLNVLWLGVAIIGFNIFLSVYVTPFNGLIAELGHTQNERVFISTLLAVTWGLGMITANSVFVFKGLVAEYLEIDGFLAFQYLIGLFSLMAFVLMALPVIFINEEKYCVQTAPVEGNPWSQMVEVLKIPNFRNYMWAELLYWFSAQFVQLGVAYYITTLSGMEEKYTTFVIAGVAAFAFISFPLMVPLTRKYGKRELLLLGFILYTGVFLLISLMGILPIPLWLSGILLVLLNTLPMAIFGILPMALVSDMATEDAHESGKFRAATFFGVKFFTMKIGLSLTSLLFPTLLLLGNSVENNIGVRLTAIVGMFGCVAAYFLMRRVHEPKAEPIRREAYGDSPISEK